MICQKEFTFTILSAPTLDWNDMVWDIFAATFGGTLVGSAVGDTVIFDLTDVNSCGAIFHGSMLYTGPVANCRVTYTTTTMNGLPTPIGGCAIYQDSVLVRDTADPFTGGHDVTTVGVDPFDFTIAAGVNSVIEVFGTPTIGAPPHPFMALQFAGLQAVGDIFFETLP